MLVCFLNAYCASRNIQQKEKKKHLILKKEECVRYSYDKKNPDGFKCDLTERKACQTFMLGKLTAANE